MLSHENYILINVFDNELINTTGKQKRN